MSRLDEIKKRQAEWRADPEDDYTDDPDMDWLIEAVEVLSGQREQLQARTDKFEARYELTCSAFDYQRRHRKWALKKADLWLGMYRLIQAECDLLREDDEQGS